MIPTQQKEKRILEAQKMIRSKQRKMPARKNPCRRSLLEPKAVWTIRFQDRVVS